MHAQVSGMGARPCEPSCELRIHTLYIYIYLYIIVACKDAGVCRRRRCRAPTRPSFRG
jgi:hypothetical protein